LLTSSRRAARRQRPRILGSGSANCPSQNEQQDRQAPDRPGRRGGALWAASETSPVRSVSPRPNRLSHDRASLRRLRPYLARIHRALAFTLEHLLGPKAVVLLGPFDIDLARSHGRECTLHTQRADVDMT